METMRSHNEGSLFQRKSGRDKGVWVAVVTMRDGRRATRTERSRDDAKAQLVELLRLRDAGAPITGRIRLSDFLERWVSEDHGWSPATARKHRSIVEHHLVPAVGFTRLSELSVAGVDDAIARRDVGPRTQAHIRATLRRALADALRDGLVQRNVGGLSRPVRQPHTERPILDANQARLLIESTKGTRYGPLWTILVTTGLRISEALGLAWSAVDFGGNDAGYVAVPNAGGPAGLGHRGSVPGGGPLDGRSRRDPRHALPSLTIRHQLARENGEWVYRKPKTSKGRRVVPLTAVGVEALRAQRATQDADLGERPRPIDGLVFTSERGNPLHAENMSKLLATDLAAAGLPRVTCHDLRHACATLLYSMGIPMPTISDMLGHSSTRVTDAIYRHRVPELQQAAADAMQRALG